MTVVTEWASRHGVGPEALSELLTLLDPTTGERQDAAENTEAGVQARLILEAPKRGCALWRNNSGACFDDTGRLIRYGVGNTSKKLNDVWKSSDLIGIAADGKFLAVEVKAPGWKSPKNARERAQASFLGTVRSRGGYGLFAQSVLDVFP